MDEQAAAPGTGGLRPERERGSGAAIRVTIGILLTAYYLRALVAVVRGLPANPQVHAKADYVAPWWPRVPDWPFLGLIGTAATGVNRLVMAGLVVGGVAIIAKHRRGMQVGLVALAVSLVQDLLFSLPTSLALAMGWMRISFASPASLAEVSSRVKDLPPSAMRMAGEFVLVVTLLGMAARAGVIVWLRRYLRRTRPPSAA
jgi:hypothetical protein